MANSHDDDQTRSHLVLQAGTKIDRFEILDRLGAGGMGEVYVALDTSLDRKVALKFLPDKYLDNEEVKLRFVREAKAAASLNHPNIVTVHEVNEFKGRPYFVMEHLEGEPLHKLCHDRRLPLSEVVDLGIQIASALQHAHEKDVVHRDIKSSNVVIDAAGRPRIIDFGLAAVRDEHDLTKMGSTIGTVSYMSPEQTRGEAVDARSDLFSFGVVLYEMVAGRTPFRRDTDVATMQAVATEAHDPVSRYAGKVPPDLERILQKLLEKDKKLRYQSAADVAADLNRLSLDFSGRSTATHMALKPVSSTGKKVGFTLTGLAIVAAVIAILVFKPWTLEVASDSVAQASEPRLAVMYFDNLSDPDDSKRLGEIAASLVITDLSESDFVQVVSSQRLHDILNLLGQAGKRTIPRDVATEVAREAGARWILNGDILQEEPYLMITSQIIDVASGDIIASQRIEGTEKQSMFQVIDSLTVAVKSDLSLPAAAMTEADPDLANMTTSSTDAYRLLVEAKDEMLGFRRDKAVPLLKQAIEIDSSFAMAYLWLSEASVNDSTRKWAISRAHELRDKVSALERAHIEIQRRALANDVQGALDTINATLENHPDDKMALVALAGISNQRFPEDAKAANLNILEIDPLYRLAYNNLAYLYARQNNMDSAIWAINEYIRLGSEDANPYDTRGELYMLSGKIPEAIASFKKALERDSTFMISRENLMFCYIMDGQYDKADSVIRKRIENTPAKWVPYQELMLTYIPAYRGQYDQVKDILNAMIKVDSVQGVPDPAIRAKIANIAIIDFVEGRYDSVVTLLEPHADLLVKAGRDYAAVIGAMIASYIELGDTASARDLMKRLQKMVPYDPKAGTLAKGVAGLALAHYAYGNLDKAFEMFSYLDNRDPSSATRQFLGIIELDRGNLPEAIEHFEVANKRMDRSKVEFAVFTNEIHYLLGLAYEEAGWTDRATDEYRKYLDRMKDGDQDTPTVIDSRERLKALSPS